jgi:hypothetical protein
VLIRQTAPVLGAAEGPYETPGEWHVNVSVRALRSDTHYRLDERQVQREELGTFVINRQFATDLTVSRAFTPRFAMSVGVPFSSASWSIPSPTAPVPGPRAPQRGRGIGDVTVMSRLWLLPTKTHTNGNVGIGVGMKAPTGGYAEQDVFVDSNGENPQPRYVDQSVQPGDGGWGLMLEAQAFRSLARAQIFASGDYLVNPRDTNGTPSVSVSRLPPGRLPPASAAGRLVNSVPDQYVARAGGAMAIGRLLVASVSYRIEGQRRYDLIGASHGFRRPGLEMFLEPGISIARGSHSASLSVPIGFYRNRKPDPYTGLAGDATFPGFIVMANYGLRLGVHHPKVIANDPID